VEIQPKSLDSIISGFQKTIKNLDAFISDGGKKVTTINNKVAGLEVKRGSIESDVRKATSISEKLKALIEE
jgi:hypothetical protein